MVNSTDGHCAVLLKKAQAVPGKPGKATLLLSNQCQEMVQVVSSAFEVKRAYIGSPHALPEAGWGYAVTTALEPGLALPPCSELWARLELDRRTAFGGLITSGPPPDAGPHLYLCARLLYRRRRGELLETGFYQRLSYPAMTFSIVEPADERINYAGAIILSSRVSPCNRR
jgi:hypothetical protein